MASRHHLLIKLGVKVLAISTDSVYSHKIFSETSPAAKTIQYPLLSDRSHQISLLYGVLREALGFAFRATFIITPEGKVSYASLYPPEVGREIDEIIRIIQALQFEKSTGLAVPAEWHPGMPGIERDFNMVGRI